MIVTLITLTTDFGVTDGYVAAMKGVILGIAPQVTLVDITHQIAPQQVTQAAYVLQSVLPCFPPDAIHVVVVDPGVGSERRPLAVQTNRALLVGPDNGVFTYALQADPAALCVVLDQPIWQRLPVSRTFHGRDIFAPAAAHLANGVTLAQLGTRVLDPLRLEVAAPHRAHGLLHGSIVHVDRFGNLISNIPGDWLIGGHWLIHIGQQTIDGLSLTYAEAAPGALLALISSDGTLEVAVREGDAAHRLAAGVGAAVTVKAHP